MIIVRICGWNKKERTMYYRESYGGRGSIFPCCFIARQIIVVQRVLYLVFYISSEAIMSLTP
jgi:hypothetical protein